MVCNSIFEQLDCTVEEPGLAGEVYEDEEKKLSEIIVDYPVPKYIKRKGEKRCCQRSNRQEALFPFGKFGISLIMFEFQVVLSSGLLCFIALVWYEVVDIHKYGHWAVYILLAIGIVLYLYLLLLAIPMCLKRYMLVTNVLLI
jgi:hypothetical protein